MPRMSGSRFMSETFKGYGVTHLFVMPYVLNPVLRDCEQLGIRRVMCHSEKGAAYMADASRGSAMSTDEMGFRHSRRTALSVASRSAESTFRSR